MRAIAEKYRDVSDMFVNISVEAEDTIMRLGVYQVIGSEDWTIYGCCRICENYDRGEGMCLISGNHGPRDNFCFECRPNDPFDCGICSPDSCNIFNLPSVDIDLKYRRDGEESVDKFRIMTDYHQDSGLIIIGNDPMEFNFKFCNVDDLIELKEFLKGEGDYFSEGVRVFTHLPANSIRSILKMSGWSGRGTALLPPTIVKMCDWNWFWIPLLLVR